MTMDLTKSEGGAPAAQADLKQGPRFVPPADVYESAEEYVILASMPGCDSDGIDVQLENGRLSLYGRVAPRELPEGGWLLREYETGDYARSFNVTESVDAERVSADYRDGILTIRLPKVEAAKPRRIEVRAKRG